MHPRVANYEITPRGEIKIESDASSDDAEGNLPGVTFGPGNVFLGMDVAVLPEKPLKAGDRWEGTVVENASEGGGQLPIKYNSKALGQVQYDGRSCWKIKTNFRTVMDESQPTRAGIEVQVKVVVTGDVIWLFDPKRGLLITADGTAKGTVDAEADTVAEGQVTVNGGLDLSFHTKLVEYNGQKVPGEITRRPLVKGTIMSVRTRTVQFVLGLSLALWAAGPGLADPTPATPLAYHQGQGDRDVLRLDELHHRARGGGGASR